MEQGTNRAGQIDPLLKSAFLMKDRLRRLIWKLTWGVLCKYSPTPLHRWRCAILKLFGAQIGTPTYVYPNTKIWAPWLLKTGRLVTIGPGVEIYNPGEVELGHHTIVSQDAYLCGATHDYNSPDFTYLKKQIRTEPYTWICARAIVLPGVKCGEGSVLGAGSVRSKDMDAWMVYTGNPAILVKPRKNPKDAKTLA